MSEGKRGIVIVMFNYSVIVKGIERKISESSWIMKCH